MSTNRASALPPRAAYVPEASLRLRPRARRRRLSRRLLFGIPLLAGTSIVAVLLVVWGLGYLGGNVDVTGVSVAYAGGLLNGTSVNRSFSVTTGASVIVSISAWNNGSAPTANGGNVTCIDSVNATPGGFSVVGLSPTNYCLWGQTWGVVYVSLEAPSKPYTGPITLTVAVHTEYHPG